MIDINKVKDINNKPNLILRNGDRWTNLAQKRGLSYKGISYLVCRWETEEDIDIYWDAMLYGGKDFWTKNDSYNAMHFHENKRDIKEWIDSEKRKNRVLG